MNYAEHEDSASIKKKLSFSFNFMCVRVDKGSRIYEAH